MRNKYNYLTVFLLLLPSVFTPLVAKPGDNHVTGRVFDANTKNPLPSVSVSSNDIRSADVTDGEGRFSVKATKSEILLTFSKAGYYTSKVNSYGRDSIDVYLQKSLMTASSETVTLPSGDVDASYKTGSAEDLSFSRVGEAQMSVSDALSGRFTGLRVITKSGMPGEGSFLNMRGVRSLNADNTPLIVIDGMPYLVDENTSSIVNGYSPDILEAVNPDNIENITFLKGADAMQYGSLGSNGVLMVNTKKGTVRQTSVEFTTTEGVAFNSRTIPMLSGMAFNRYIADIASGKYSDTESIGADFPFLSGNVSAADKVKYGFNTSWQKEIYKPAFQSNNVLKVTGGDAIVQYFVTAGYQNIDGTLDGTSKGKFSTSGSTAVNFSEKLKAAAAISFDFINAAEQEQGMTEETNPILAAYSYSPITGVYEVDNNGGILKEYGSVDPAMGVSNPVSLLKNVDAKSKTYDFNVNLGVDYKIVRDLKAFIKFGILYKYIKDDIFIGGRSVNSIAPLSDGIALNTVRSGSSESKDYYGNAGLEYNLRKNKHSAIFKGGWQIVSSGYNSSMGSGINTATDRYKTLSDVSSSGRHTGGYEDVQRWMNFYLSANYDYNRILFASLAGQVDRSSSYGAYSDLWYFTPAVQGAWKLSNMPFLRSSKSVSDLKLRAEYSVNSNSRFRNSLSSYYYVLKQLKDVSGLVRAGIPNEKLGPEKVSNIDIGLDFALYGDKLRLSADIYEQKTTDMIIASSISGAYGFPTAYGNDGAMRSRGVDANLSAAIFSGKFYWRVGGNISFEKTEIRSLGSEDKQFVDYGDGVVLINKKGKSPFSYYGYRTAGVYSRSEEASSEGLSTVGGYSFTGGDIRFADANGDKVINDGDKTIIGSPEPDFFGGVFSEMSWKGFRLYANFSYCYGNDIYNATRRYNESGSSFHNQAASLDRRWIAEGQVTDIPRAAYGDPAGNSQFSDRWIEDGSYFKLKELTLSWETDKRFLFTNGIKLYLTGENLLCLTKYTGVDPEFAYSYNMATLGMDLGKVPVPRVVKAGIVLNL